jgi:hypothetical protein
MTRSCRSDESSARLRQLRPIQSPNVTAFWLSFNLAGSSDTVTLVVDGIPNNRLVSAAVCDEGAVPEPGTWALMLLGFGGIGMAMRRGRKQTARLMQIA